MLTDLTTVPQDHRLMINGRLKMTDIRCTVGSIVAHLVSYLAVIAIIKQRIKFDVYCLWLNTTLSSGFGELLCSEFQRRKLCRKMEWLGN